MTSRWLMECLLMQRNRNCEGCAIGKHQLYLFPKKSENNTSQLLELIHNDICGPMNVNSVGSSKYFVTIIDDS